MSQGCIKQGSITIVYLAVLKLHSKQYSVFHSHALASVYKKAQHTTTSHTREQLPVIRMAATQALSLFFYIKTNFLCLALVLCQSNVVFSQLNYHVDSLDDSRNAMLSYFSGSSKPGGKCFVFVCLCFFF